MEKVKEKVDSKLDELLSHPYVLIVNNDDYNTFDWVISCLIKICGHGTEQASQCAHIIHFNGQCDVKRGSKETISKMKEKLQQAGLSVTIEKSK
jgi:ATP-dependent Clp protease adaptor protein ClpS